VGSKRPTSSGGLCTLPVPRAAKLSWRGLQASRAFCHAQCHCHLPTVMMKHRAPAKALARPYTRQVLSVCASYLPRHVPARAAVLEAALVQDVLETRGQPQLLSKLVKAHAARITAIAVLKDGTGKPKRAVFVWQQRR
jgi:hypothetical protein